MVRATCEDPESLGGLNLLCFVDNMERSLMHELLTERRRNRGYSLILVSSLRTQSLFVADVHTQRGLLRSRPLEENNEFNLLILHCGRMTYDACICMNSVESQS